MGNVPHGTKTPGPAGPRRRAVLTSGLVSGLALPWAGALLTGCSGSTSPGDAHPAEPGAALRERATRDSADLLARYDATAAAHPALADRLRPLRAEVALHLQAFTAGAASSAAASAPASASARASAVPGDGPTALAALAAAERHTADARAAALTQAPPELARLLASVAAAGACHAMLLQGGA